MERGSRVKPDGDEETGTFVKGHLKEGIKKTYLKETYGFTAEGTFNDRGELEGEGTKTGTDDGSIEKGIFRGGILIED
jgi:hypothetical protein